jgi:hypothetical protein
MLIEFLSVAVAARRVAYAHDCNWLVNQFSVGECEIHPGNDQIIECRKNPAEDYSCSASDFRFPENGTYFDANITCVFPGYRDSWCQYHLRLLTESRAEWARPGFSTCTDTCGGNESGTDVVIVAVGATIGGVALIGVIVFIVRRIWRDAEGRSYSPRGDLDRGLTIGDEGQAPPADSTTAERKHTSLSSHRKTGKS